MGQLIYGPGTVYEMDDRTLAHVKLALTAKLRRQESFLLSWPIGVDQGSGRASLWIAPSIPLQFRFSGGRPPTINKPWVVAMLETSHNDRGLVILPEAEIERVTSSASDPTA
ncbi:hypothetical protein [Rathayibacter sp. VKM Ac-2857]|uniref:DUF7882 family protein n=1 Tax=Rathayibacter sp. VKM Ac-2857 TaxID=2739020 RepID=UPI0015659994|nr:hypothetical protein [Rathayibacter sp. VKM Ac-2857]